MKYKLIIILLVVCSFGLAQTPTNNPSVYRWVNGSIPANGASAPLSIGGNTWYQTNNKLAFYNSGLAVWQNILTETLASTTYIPVTGTSNWTGFKKAGNIFGIGSGSGAGYSSANTTPYLDVAQGSISMVLGADNATQTRTDNTTKVSAVGSSPYALGSIPTGIFSTDNNSLGSLLKFGGGTSRFNAVTKIGFFLATNITTPTGTETAYITSGGFVYPTDISSGFTANHIANIGYNDTRYLGVNTISSASTLTLSSRGYYKFTGVTSTWTLPALTGNTGNRYTIVNRGTGIITLNSNAGANDIDESGIFMATMPISTGSSVTLYCDGVKWIILD